MSFPCISERKFASLSLVGSVVLTITTSIWFSQANPERFDITLIAGILMFCSANLIYFLFSDRLRPATLAGSSWMTIIIWLLFMMRVASADSHNDPYSPDYEPHGSGFLWLALPLFYVSSLICFHCRHLRPVLSCSSLEKFIASSILGIHALVFYRDNRCALDFLSHRTFDYVGYRYVD